MDETRPLWISHAIAATLGVSWLALVYILPPPPTAIALMRPEEAAAVEVQFEDEKPPKPEPPKPAPVVETTPVTTTKPPTPAELKKAKKEEAAMADAFGGATSSALVGDVSNTLRGVNVAKGDKTAEGGGGKAVIAYGSGGTSVRTPGRGIDPSVAAAGSTIGKVNAAGSVTRGSIAVSAPSVVRSVDGGPSGRETAKLGTFVRARQAQLQYCYQEIGLAANPKLAGSVSVTVQLEPAGSVSDVKVVNRTWSGAGAAEAEACIVQRVRGWGFPASSKAGTESYSFSFIFNK
jgi:hypothetical protein